MIIISIILSYCSFFFFSPIFFYMHFITSTNNKKARFFSFWILPSSAQSSKKYSNFSRVRVCTFFVSLEKSSFVGLDFFSLFFILALSKRSNYSCLCCGINKKRHVLLVSHFYILFFISQKNNKKSWHKCSPFLYALWRKR